ncbi:MAG: hypothetical protein EXS14_04315 [Planctomycetes bacterium]|nr:hypothetical protein [Planctomycetota bacterium]
MLRLYFSLLAFAAMLPAQVGYGTLLQSLSPIQTAGLTAVSLPGNPSITTNEIVALSQGEPNGSGRSLFNAQSLGLLFGDRNGDGFPFDWPDIDALEVVAPPPNTLQPSPFDLRFSFGANVLAANGSTLVNTGDIVRLTGIGTYAIHIPRGAFQAAIGTNAALNVDAYAELADGAVLVSFAGAGTGNNIINPLNGQTGNLLSWTGADVFVIRPPFGALPALFAYRQSDLAQVVNFYYGGSYVLSEVSDIEEQPNVGWVSNQTWDPAGVYQGGQRPRLLWTVAGDENVFCWSSTLNPLSTSHNFYALIGGTTGSSMGYATNLGGYRVVADALAIWPRTMTTSTRMTIDASSLTPTAGSSIYFDVRSREAGGTFFELVLSGTTSPGMGITLGTNGFMHLMAPYTDPLLLWSISPAVAPLFITGGASAQGTGGSITFTLPANAAGLALVVQAVRVGNGWPLSAPLFFKVL